MSNIALDLFNKIYKVIGEHRDYTSDRKSRKRPSEDLVPSLSRKYRKVSDLPKIYSSVSVDEPKTTRYLPVKPFKTRYSKPNIHGMSNASKFIKNYSEYADIEFSDGEENDVFVSDTAKSKTGDSFGACRKVYMNGKDKEILNKKKKIPRSTFVFAKTSPPPIVPLSRGALMLSRVPGLHPINKIQSTFAPTAYGTPIIQNGNSSKKLFKLKQSDYNENPIDATREQERLRDHKKNMNSIVTKTLNLEERNKYFDLLKECAPSIYTAASYKTKAQERIERQRALRAAKEFLDQIPQNCNVEDVNQAALGREFVPVETACTKLSLIEKINQRVEKISTEEITQHECKDQVPEAPLTARKLRAQEHVRQTLSSQQEKPTQKYYNELDDLPVGGRPPICQQPRAKSPLISYEIVPICPSPQSPAPEIMYPSSNEIIPDMVIIEKITKTNQTTIYNNPNDEDELLIDFDAPDYQFANDTKHLKFPPFGSENFLDFGRPSTQIYNYIHADFQKAVNEAKKSLMKQAIEDKKSQDKKKKINFDVPIMDQIDIEDYCKSAPAHKNNNFVIENIPVGTMIRVLETVGVPDDLCKAAKSSEQVYQLNKQIEPICPTSNFFPGEKPKQLFGNTGKMGQLCSNNSKAKTNVCGPAKAPVYRDFGTSPMRRAAPPPREMIDIATSFRKPEMRTATCSPIQFTTTNNRSTPQNLSLTRHQMEFSQKTEAIQSSQAYQTPYRSPQSNICPQTPGIENGDYDDECEVVQNSTTDVEPVNSLRNKLSLKPEYQDGWLENIFKKYGKKQEQLNLDIIAQTASLNDLQINTRRNENEIRKQHQDFQLAEPIVIEEYSEDEVEEELPQLTPEQLQLVHRVANCGSSDEEIINKFNLHITRYDLKTLLGTNWLNDNVINFYMNLLNKRSEDKQCLGHPKVMALNTFFLPRLLGAGYDGVRRWTRRIDIFSYDLIPIPVHVGKVHWTLAIIDFKIKTIKYYDSMGKPNDAVLQRLFSYINEESMDKKKCRFDMCNWTMENVSNIPLQFNGSDCGVFSCMFAEYITRNSPITFSQENMAYFRKKMIYEIATGKLLT